MRYVIETTQDVKNPHPDRRCGDWYKKPVIKAGSRFIVDTMYGVDPALDIIKSSVERYGYVARHKGLGQAIDAASKKGEPRTLRELMVVHDCDIGYDFILEELMLMGRITAEDFAAVGEVINAKE